MSLPHRIATLLYCFHEDGRVLLIERRHEPNFGLFSPPGGKLCEDRRAEQRFSFITIPESAGITFQDQKGPAR